MDLDIEKQQIMNDINERIYNMKCLGYEAESTGIETVITLADQNEQLQKLKSHLITVDSTLIHTKHNLNHLKRARQRLFDLFSHPFIRLSLSKHHFTENKPQNLTSTRRHSIPKRLEHNSTNFEIDDEFEKLTHRLKGLAIDIHDQLIGQNFTLEDIHQNAIKSSNAIEKQNITIQSLPKKSFFKRIFSCL